MSVDTLETLKCPVCNGKGTTVNPNIDDRGLCSDDFLDDPEFVENYMDGVYDIQCRACEGKGKILGEDLERLAQAAEDRRLTALENGDYDAYSGAGDYRHGY